MMRKRLSIMEYLDAKVNQILNKEDHSRA